MERLGLEQIILTKVAAHRLVASATSRYEAWLFWHNTAADHAAKTANLDRGESFWTLWQKHVREVTAAQEVHAQAWNLHLQVALMSVKDDQALTLDTVEIQQPKHTRVFDKLFDVSAWQGDLHKQFANEYGHGMATRVATWWKTRTEAGGTQVRWISFVHLYLDYQLTWGCAGPLQHKTAWLDGFLRPYLDAAKYPFLKRLKWFRRCLKQFWRESKQQVGLETCRCESEILQSHIAAASICWDAATLRITETWLAEHCKGPLSRGTKQVQALPIANAIPGMRLARDASNDAVQSADSA